MLSLLFVFAAIFQAGCIHHTSGTGSSFLRVKKESTKVTLSPKHVAEVFGLEKFT